MTDSPLYRSSDPETSREAAESIENLSTRQAHVLEACRTMGWYTLEALVNSYDRRWFGEQWTQQAPSGIRTRHKELVDRGLIVFTGGHGTSLAGRPARLWKVSSSLIWKKPSDG